MSEVTKREAWLIKRAEEGRLIPEKTQKPLREKLKLIRLSRKKFLHEINGLGGGTANTYENHDITTMQLWHLHCYAESLDLTLRDLVLYLFDSENEAPGLVNERNRNLDKVIRMMHLFDEVDQERAVLILEALTETSRVKHSMKGTTRASNPKKPQTAAAS